MLALVHISSRYHVGKVLEEAREVFEPTVAPRDFDLIEIPFPERGEPKLVPTEPGSVGSAAQDSAARSSRRRRSRTLGRSRSSPGTAE